MRQALVSVLSATTIVGLFALCASPVAAKTPSECNADYAANRAAIKASGQARAAYVAACRAEANAPPAPAPIPPSDPMAPKPIASPAEMNLAPPIVAPAAIPQAQTQDACPGESVVWVNAKSGVYYFKESRRYGATKAGVFMCESAAKAAGRHAANDKRL